MNKQENYITITGEKLASYLRFHSIAKDVITWPVALVPAPPAVIAMAPVVVIVPAKDQADPARVLVCSEKLPTVPTVGAEPLMASP